MRVGNMACPGRRAGRPLSIRQGPFSQHYPRVGIIPRVELQVIVGEERVVAEDVGVNAGEDICRRRGTWHMKAFMWCMELLA